ncbi:hypothetical protein Tco_1148353 [Tanacetum coccineum]
MALWILDTTIPICCMAVLPSNRLCRELDPTMTKLRIYVLMKGLSPIVISKGTSPRGQECSPEKPTSGIYESTLSELVVLILWLLRSGVSVLGIDWCHAHGLRRSFLEPIKAFSVSIWSSVGGYLSCFNPSALSISLYKWHLQRGAGVVIGVSVPSRNPQEKHLLARLPEEDSLNPTENGGLVIGGSGPLMDNETIMWYERSEMIAEVNHSHSSLSELLRVDEGSPPDFCCHLLCVPKAFYLRIFFLPCPHPCLGHFRIRLPFLFVFELSETLYGELELRKGSRD